MLYNYFVIELVFDIVIEFDVVLVKLLVLNNKQKHCQIALIITLHAPYGRRVPVVKYIAVCPVNRLSSNHCSLGIKLYTFCNDLSIISGGS